MYHLLKHFQLASGDKRFLTSDMRKFTFILLLTLNSFVVFSQQITRIDGSRITGQQLDNKVNQLVKDAAVMGIAVSIFNDGKPVYKKAFGYKNAETRLPLQPGSNIYGASLSKAVFAVLVMKLVEEKIIDLDKPLHSYLPKPVYEYGKGASWGEDLLH